MTRACITSGREVRDLVRDGWELWLIADSPLPGRWELRRGREIRAVHWDAILRIRRHYLPWFEAHTEDEQHGRYGWITRAKQTTLREVTG